MIALPTFRVCINSLVLLISWGSERLNDIRNVIVRADDMNLEVINYSSAGISRQILVVVSPLSSRIVWFDM